MAMQRRVDRSVTVRRCQLFGLFCLLFLVTANPGWCEDGKETTLWAVMADRIHLKDGKVLSAGLVIIRDGRIEVVGTNLKIPDGATHLFLGMASDYYDDNGTGTNRVRTSKWYAPEFQEMGQPSSPVRKER